MFFVRQPSTLFSSTHSFSQLTLTTFSMRAIYLLCALGGLVNAVALSKRQDNGSVPGENGQPISPETTMPSTTSFSGKLKDYSTKAGEFDQYDEHKGEHARHPKTEHPEFFSLLVDEKCDNNDYNEYDTSYCTFENYAIRLEKGIVVATPYNKWWDSKLPIFFVDDDTQMYTVSMRI